MRRDRSTTIKESRSTQRVDHELLDEGADGGGIQLIWRVREDDVEGASWRLSKHLFDWRVDDLDIQPERLGVAPAELGRTRVTLDQQSSTGATAGRLQPNSPRAGVQIAEGQASEGIVRPAPLPCPPMLRWPRTAPRVPDPWSGGPGRLAALRSVVRREIRQ